MLTKPSFNLEPCKNWEILLINFFLYFLQLYKANVKKRDSKIIEAAELYSFEGMVVVNFKLMTFSFLYFLKRYFLIQFFVLFDVITFLSKVTKH